MPATGTAITTGTFTFKTQNGSWTSDTFNASANSFSDANAVVTKN
jgi:hypothetical protein